MGLAWLVLAGIAVWALIRLGRQGERAGRGQWRVAATPLSAALIGGGALAAFRGAWLAAAGLVGAGLWLTYASRQRPLPPRAAALTDAEARAILGVGPEASAAKIQAAYRKVMARAHPDQGGTEGLASRVNAARDKLLKR